MSKIANGPQKAVKVVCWLAVLTTMGVFAVTYMVATSQAVETGQVFTFVILQPVAAAMAWWLGTARKDTANDLLWVPERKRASGRHVVLTMLALGMFVWFATVIKPGSGELDAHATALLLCATVATLAAAALIAASADVHERVNGTPGHTPRSTPALVAIGIAIVAGLMALLSFNPWLTQRAAGLLSPFLFARQAWAGVTHALVAGVGCAVLVWGTYHLAKLARRRRTGGNPDGETRGVVRRHQRRNTKAGQIAATALAKPGRTAGGATIAAATLAGVALAMLGELSTGAKTATVLGIGTAAYVAAVITRFGGGGAPGLRNRAALSVGAVWLLTHGWAVGSMGEVMSLETVVTAILIWMIAPVALIPVMMRLDGKAVNEVVLDAALPDTGILSLARHALWPALGCALLLVWGHHGGWTQTLQIVTTLTAATAGWWSASAVTALATDMRSERRGRQ